MKSLEEVEGRGIKGRHKQREERNIVRAEKKQRLAVRQLAASM